MTFRDEKKAVNEIAELVLDAAASLYKTTKYVYALTKDDFYNCDIKDVFKIILNNILESESLRVLGLTVDDDQCAEMNCQEYGKVFSLVVYSFAVRLPLLKNLEIRGDRLTDLQIRAAYDTIMAKGVVNHGDAIGESFEEIRLSVRKGRPIAPYNADWYKAYLCSHVPALTEVNNRNLFLLGAVDMLFVLFYACIERELERLLKLL